MAILALAFPFFPGALGSDLTSLTFKLSAVDDVVGNSSEGPSGAEEEATLRVAREEGPVEKAAASMMATTRKTAAITLLFMVFMLCSELGGVRSVSRNRRSMASWEWSGVVQIACSLKEW